MAAADGAGGGGSFGDGMNSSNGTGSAATLFDASFAVTVTTCMPTARLRVSSENPLAPVARGALSASTRYSINDTPMLSDASTANGMGTPERKREPCGLTIDTT